LARVSKDTLRASFAGAGSGSGGGTYLEGGRKEVRKEVGKEGRSRKEGWMDGGGGGGKDVRKDRWTDVRKIMEEEGKEGRNKGRK
jgi:hypothetical protein